MSMNIKGEEAHRLARELAEETGETVTAAVTIALRERVERVRHAGDATLVGRIMKIAAEAAPRFGKSFSSLDVDELLYDERGLPRG